MRTHASNSVIIPNLCLWRARKKIEKGDYRFEVDENAPGADAPQLPSDVAAGSAKRAADPGGGR